MSKLDERAEKCHWMITDRAESDKNMLNMARKLCHPHPKKPYIADCLDVKYNEEFG
jgi:hypothetical protein